MSSKSIFFAAAALLTVSFGANASEARVPVVNVNLASADELDEKLIGVGKKTAAEIVRHRKEYGQFRNMDDLDQVKFIGDSFISKNESRIIFEE